MVADKPLEAVFANLFIVTVGSPARSAFRRFRSRSHSGHRQTRDHFRVFDRHRLDDLSAQRETHRMTSRKAEMCEQSDSIVGKLANRVTMIRLTAMTCASQVENDGPVAPAE